MAGRQGAVLVRTPSLACHGRTHSRSRRIAVAGLLLFVTLLPLHADTAALDMWFETDPRAGEYRGHREQLERFFETASEHGLPAAPLLQLLREAAAKRVPPAALKTALTRELERLRTASQVLDDSHLHLSETQRDDTLMNISLYLQSGLSPDLLRTIFTERESLTRASEAAAAVVEIRQATTLSEPQLQRLVQALYKSSLPTGGYRSIPAAFLQAHSWGIALEEAYEIVVRELEAEGGLVQINNALRRRRTR